MNPIQNPFRRALAEKRPQAGMYIGVRFEPDDRLAPTRVDQSTKRRISNS
jgi:hypothetical protein